MTSEVDTTKKCFTFIWKLEDVKYCCRSPIESSFFTVDEIHETNWRLKLYLSALTDTEIGFYLVRKEDEKKTGKLEIDYELAFLSSDGRVLQSMVKRDIFSRYECHGKYDFITRNEVFFERKSEFLPEGILTARCRIWKSEGEMSKNVECTAGSRIVVEKRTSTWSIEKFSTIKFEEIRTCEIKSLDNDRQLMSLELFLAGGLIYEDTIRFKIIPNFINTTIYTLQMSIEDASKNTTKVFEGEFSYPDIAERKEFELFCSMRKLMEKESAYLPNDVLSLRCEYAFSTGEIEEKEHSNLDSDLVLPVPESTLNDDLKSMLNDRNFSDIFLNTRSQTYPAHTVILGARSHVFSDMISGMKEREEDFVEIEDLNDDTVLRMLKYIYCDEVEELEWTGATEILKAAENYQILHLKSICSTYLKTNLSDLSDLKLAAETMRLKFKK